ncbi:MAG TPA: GlsB/YeaQ/YmgE family stress response membrane protein [Dehalococcoidia bacterium]|nr:GlsB/YeaQ/YmgE family stress response membrane protein [Dehalococcoidia bacterium]
MTIEIPGLIAWILIGLVAGWLASSIMKRGGSMLGNVMLGMIGAIVGGVVFSLIGLGGASNIIGSIAIATVGAIIILAVAGR